MLVDMFIQDFVLESATIQNNGGIIEKTWTVVWSYKWRMTRSTKQKIIQLTQWKIERVQPEWYTLYCPVDVPVIKDHRVVIEGHIYLVNAVYKVHDGLWPHHLSCDISNRK